MGFYSHWDLLGNKSVNLRKGRTNNIGNNSESSHSDHESAAAFPDHPISTKSFDGQGHLRKTEKKQETQGHRRVPESPGA